MKRHWETIVVAVLAAVSAVLLSTGARVGAFNPQPDPPAFGMMGVDPFATARLNATCPDGGLPGSVPPGPCMVQLEWEDSNGQVLKQITATLQPGHSTYLDFRPAEAGFRQRMELQPSIKPVGSGFVLTTAEVFDTFTGRTLFVVNPTEPRSLNPVGAAGQ